jgi:hypothetical protein
VVLTWGVTTSSKSLCDDKTGAAQAGAPQSIRGFFYLPQFSLAGLMNVMALVAVVLAFGRAGAFWWMGAVVIFGSAFQLAWVKGGARLRSGRAHDLLLWLVIFLQSLFTVTIAWATFGLAFFPGAVIALFVFVMAAMLQSVWALVLLSPLMVLPLLPSVGIAMGVGRYLAEFFWGEDAA